MIVYAWLALCYEHVDTRSLMRLPVAMFILMQLLRLEVIVLTNSCFAAA